jgi:hypothetical protein
VAEENSDRNMSLGEGRRAERRILVNVAVEITLVKGEGGKFSERTFIEDVSDLGCRFTTRGPAQQGDTVSLKLVGPGGKILPDEESRLYQIMWVAPNKHSSTVGARLIKGETLVSAQSQPKIDAENHSTK